MSCFKHLLALVFFFFLFFLLSMSWDPVYIDNVLQ